MKKMVLAAALAAVSMPICAQQQTAAIVEAPGQENIVRSGTEVVLAMREELTTKGKKLRVGQRFQMEVASDVIKNGVVVIPAGTPAIGEITEVRNKGMWGKSGYIGAQAVSLRLGSRAIRLSGTFDDKGVTGTGGVVASIALLPIAGFFTTGTSAVLPMGSQTKAFLDDDIAFVPVAADPVPVLVPVTTSVEVAQATPTAAPIAHAEPVAPPTVVSAPVVQHTPPAAPERNKMPAGLTCVTCQ